MTELIAGLLIFLGVHSVRIVADDWRSRTIARIGPGAWKGAYALASLVGLVLLVQGYGLTRQAPVDLWMPPVWTRHLAALLTVPSFLLIVAAYVPRNRIRIALRHPMILGVKLWALAHLLANGRLADLLLFGGFLLWAVLDFRSARRRPEPVGAVTLRPAMAADLAVIVVGLVSWAAFAFWLHGSLIGVRPFG